MVSRTKPARSPGSISHCPPEGTTRWADRTGAARMLARSRTANRIGTPGSGFRKLDGKGARRVANPPESVGKRRRAEASNGDVEQLRFERHQATTSRRTPVRRG